MLAAFLTTIFFSLSAIFATRSIRLVGTTGANLGRLVIAFVLLGAYAHSVGRGLSGAGRTWFLLSGVIGMGLGDLALFAALPRLGSRLSVLMAQCVAVPIAMLAEWSWLHTSLAVGEIALSTVILVGVAVALAPSRRLPPKVAVRASGFVFGFLAAAGQGLGAVVSRRAYEVTAAAGEAIDGISAAYQRIAGGLLISATYFLVRHALSRRAPQPAVAADAAARGNYRRFGVVGLNALCGPVLGVSCYQWALATTPSGVVLPIVATTPLVIVPLSAWLEGERPGVRSVLGGVIAVAGVAALALVRLPG